MSPYVFTADPAYALVWGAELGLTGFDMVKQNARLPTLQLHLQGSDPYKKDQARFCAKLVEQNAAWLDLKWKFSRKDEHRAAIADVLQPDRRLKKPVSEGDALGLPSAIADASAALSRFHDFTLHQAAEINAGLDGPTAAFRRRGRS